MPKKKNRKKKPQKDDNTDKHQDEGESSNSLSFQVTVASSDAISTALPQQVATEVANKSNTDIEQTDVTTTTDVVKDNECVQTAIATDNQIGQLNVSTINDNLHQHQSTTAVVTDGENAHQTTVTEKQVSSSSDNEVIQSTDNEVTQFTNNEVTQFTNNEVTQFTNNEVTQFTDNEVTQFTDNEVAQSTGNQDTQPKTNINIDEKFTQINLDAPSVQQVVQQKADVIITVEALPHFTSDLEVDMEADANVTLIQDLDEMSDIQILKQNNIALIEEISLLKEQIEEMTVPEKVKSLYKQLFSKKKKIIKMTDEKQKLQNEMNKLLEEHTVLKNTFEKFKEDKNVDSNNNALELLDALEARVESEEQATEQVTVDELAIQQLQINYEDILSKYNVLSNDIKSLQKEKFQNIAALKDKEIEITNLLEANQQHIAANENLEAQVNKKTEILFKLNADMRELKEKSNDQSLKNQLIRSEVILKDKSIIIKSLTNELKETIDERDKLLKENEEFGKNFINRELYDNLLKESGKVEATLAEKEIEILVEETNYKKLLKTVEGLKHKIENQQSLLSLKEKESKYHLEERDEKIKVQIAYEEKLKENEECIAQLEKQLNTLSNESTKMQNENSALLTDNENLKDLTNEKESFITELEAEQKELNKRYQNLMLEIEIIAEDNERLNKSINNDGVDDNSKHRIFELQSLVQAYEIDKTSMREEIEKLVEDLDQSKNANLTLNKEKEKMKSEIEYIRGENSSMNISFESSFKEKNDLMIVLDKKNRQIQNLSEKVDLIQKENFDLEEQLVLGDEVDTKQEQSDRHQSLIAENEKLRNECISINDLLESVIVDNQQLKANQLELELAGVTMHTPPVQNQQQQNENEVDNNELAELEKLCEAKSAENVKFQSTIKKYQDEVRSINDLLETVIVENQRLKQVQWQKLEDLLMCFDKPLLKLVLPCDTAKINIAFGNK